MTKPGTTERTPEEQAFSQRVGKNIRILREAARLKQSELAQKMGVDQGTLSLYEVGKTDMPTSRLHRIAEILNVAPHVVIGADPTPDPNDQPVYALEPIKFLFSFEGNKIAVEISGRSADPSAEGAPSSEQPDAIARAA